MVASRSLYELLDYRHDCYLYSIIKGKRSVSEWIVLPTTGIVDKHENQKEGLPSAGHPEV